VLPASDATTLRTHHPHAPSNNVAVALVYYLTILRATMRLGEAQWYQRGPWVSRFGSGIVSGKADSAVAR